MRIVCTRSFRLINILLVFLALFSPTAYAQTIQYTPDTAQYIIEAYAAHYGIPAKPLLDTLECESGLNADAVGDHGTSYGVAQIHLPAHPEISKEEALDPIWSIDWAAHEFSLGHQRQWSCYRRLANSE